MSFKSKWQILTYNIGFIQKPVAQVIENGIGENEIIWLNHKYKDRFFADPFLLTEDEDFYYIVCEELVFWEGKGKISLLVVRKSDFLLVKKETLIDEPWHLSFPFVYKNEYIIPESHRGGKAYMYHIDLGKMEIDSKELICEECGFVDPVITEDDRGKEILLSSDNLSQNMFAFTKDDNGKFARASKTSLICDKKRARAAGKMFTYKGEKVFPVQDCEERYGRQTRLEKIASLTADNYTIDEIATINSDKNPPYNETMHTFNVYDDFVIIDGSKDFARFPMKIFYRIGAKIYAKRGKK